MTTIIFDCPINYMNTLPSKEMGLLKKIYGHEDSVLYWQPENGIRDNQLILTELPMVSLAYIPLKDVQKIHYDDAMQALIEHEANQEPKITAQECLKLAATLIADDLTNEETPDYMFGDLKCMFALIQTIHAHTQFSQEDEADIAKRQYKCTSAMQKIYREVATIYDNSLNGHYHRLTPKQPAESEETTS